MPTKDEYNSDTPLKNEHIQTHELKDEMNQDKLLKNEEPNTKKWASYEMDTATRVQILEETNCISHSTNNLGKSMNLIILPPAMDK